MHVGILGGGQLAQMLALAGIPLGIHFTCLEAKPDCSASSVARIIEDDFSRRSIDQLVSEVDVLTFESENISTEMLKHLSVPLYPSLKALEIAQDRLLEKQFLKNLDIPVADFFSIENVQDLFSAIQVLGLPCVLKTRREGYDGKGQYVIQAQDEVEIAYRALSSFEGSKIQLIAEKWVHFDREVSLIAVRGQNNQIKYYPLTENIHKSGILRLSKAPYYNDLLSSQAEAYLQTILESLNYVGVLAVEFFVLGQQLLVNEMAPRVHNSGHWTIEGAKTSQFENHLRALLNLPLGETDALNYSTMLNLIGEIPSIGKLMQIPSSHLHIYGKKPQKNRKLGHLTIISEKPFDEQDCQDLLSLNRTD